MRQIFYFCTFLLFFTPISGAAADTPETLRPLQTGDQITIQACQLNFNNGSSQCEPKFGKKGGVYTYRSAGGDQIELLYLDGTVRDRFTNRGGTITYYRGKEIPEDRRFDRFPPGGPPRPGMEWKVETIMKPPWSTGSRECPSVPIDDTARASEGPMVSLLIDGQSTAVQTVLIAYKADVRSCFTTGAQSTFEPRSVEIYYSPELDWIVAARYLVFTRNRVLD